MKCRFPFSLLHEFRKQREKGLSFLDVRVVRARHAARTEERINGRRQYEIAYEYLVRLDYVNIWILG